MPGESLVTGWGWLPAAWSPGPRASVLCHWLFHAGCRRASVSVSGVCWCCSSSAWLLRSCGSGCAPRSGASGGPGGVRRGCGGTSGEPWRLWGGVPLWSPRSGRRPDVRDLCWGVLPVPRFRPSAVRFPRWPGILPVPRFRLDVVWFLASRMPACTTTCFGWARRGNEWGVRGKRQGNPGALGEGFPCGFPRSGRRLDSFDFAVCAAPDLALGLWG